MADNQQRSMEQLQRDAERRMREMQQRATRAVSGNDMPPVPNFVKVNNRPFGMPQNGRGQHDRSEQAAKPTPSEPSKPNTSNRPSHSTDGGNTSSRSKGFDILKLFNFQNLKIDNDVLIIIVLIFLLSTEETDELLLLALVYIML